jgi:hypothetical protein
MDITFCVKSINVAMMTFASEMTGMPGFAAFVSRPSLIVRTMLSAKSSMAHASGRRGGDARFVGG